MELKVLLIAKIRQLTLEQANAKYDGLRKFGGFEGEVFVPANLELEADAKLLEVFEQLVAAKSERNSFVE